MTKKLLYKTLQSYTVLSIVIPGISAPTFYLLIQRMYIHETDETLKMHFKEFEKLVLPDLHSTDIETWNRYNRLVKIEPDRHIKKTTLFNTFYYDVLDDEKEPCRELNARILIDGKHYIYSSKISLIETDDLIESTFLLFLAIIIILLTGLFFITRILSKRLWKPFNHTLTQIEHFEIDKHSLPHFDDTTIDEFQRLNNSITRLIERNINIYQAQREFIENAAHELQTPLAVFQAKIDTLSQFDNMTGQQADMLQELNNGIARLNRLNKNLLLLSKIERENYGERQELNLIEVIRHQLAFFVEQATGRNISIQTAFQSTIMLYANPSLVEILLNNLLLNAIRHNIPQGLIEIVLSDKTLTISNTGHPGRLPADKLFLRFSKSNPSGQGNGLGLAIVKRIATINNWSIEYHFDNNLHIFTLHF